MIVASLGTSTTYWCLILVVRLLVITLSLLSVSDPAVSMPSVSSPSATIFGEGMLLVTDKAVEKIIKSEFVEMISEIILWLLEEKE